MIEDWVIVAFKQGYKDERTTKKLAVKNPKTVDELYKIIEVMAKAADARAWVQGQADTSRSEEEKRKGKNKCKNIAEILIAKKGKGLPQYQGKPEDLPVYYPVHRSTKHSITECSVYKKQKHEEEQQCRA
jgi:hypothetical protein